MQRIKSPSHHIFSETMYWIHLKLGVFTSFTNCFDYRQDKLGNTAVLLLADEARLRARRKKASNGQKTKARESQCHNDPNNTTNLKTADIHPQLIVSSCTSSSIGDQILSPTGTSSTGSMSDESWIIYTPESCSNQFWPYQPWEQAKKDSDTYFSHYRTLNESEVNCLKMLETNFVSAVETQLPGFSGELEEIKDFLNTSMIWAKKIVTYVKSVEDFKKLPTEVQIKCIKSSARSALTLISAYRYDRTLNAYYIQGNYVGVDMWMSAFRSHKEVAELFVNTCLSMQDEWYKDPCIHAMFHLILLFDPDGEDLLEREHLSDLQNKYLILLKHYLESKYSYSKSREYFSSILKRSREMKTLSKLFTEVLIDTDPKQIDPLTKEVFSYESI